MPRPFQQAREGDIPERIERLAYELADACLRYIPEGDDRAINSVTVEYIQEPIEGVEVVFDVGCDHTEMRLLARREMRTIVDSPMVRFPLAIPEEVNEALESPESEPTAKDEAYAP